MEAMLCGVNGTPGPLKNATRPNKGEIRRREEGSGVMLAGGRN